MKAWTRIGAVVFGAAALAAVAFGLGRYGLLGEKTVPPPKVLPQSKSIEASEKSLPAGHPVQPRHLTPKTQESRPKDPVQFAVGKRNVKALMAGEKVSWIGTSGGLIRYDMVRDKYHTYDNASGLLSNGVFSLAKMGQEIWVGTYGGGLSVLDPTKETWRNYNIPNGMGDAFVYDILRMRNGNIWIATWSGANRVINGKMGDVRQWQLFTVESTGGGLPNDWVYGLAEGANGEVWLATEGGLARYHEDKWSHWTHAEGLGAPYELVKSDMPFKNDPGKHSAHHARQKVEQGLTGVNVAYNPNYVVALEVDNAGEVWVGTWGAGLSRFDGKKWRTYTVADGLPGNHVFSLGKDPNGQIWIGTSRGLARMQNDRFVRYGAAEGLASQVVFSISFDPGGGAWVGGLGRATWFPRGIKGGG